MNSINSVGKQTIYLSLPFIQNDKFFLIGVALLICTILFVLGVVLVRIRKAKKAETRTNSCVSDDTDEMPDLSGYDLQGSGFTVEEDITLVYTNKNDV